MSTTSLFLHLLFNMKTLSLSDPQDHHLLQVSRLNTKLRRAAFQHSPGFLELITKDLEVCGKLKSFILEYGKTMFKTIKL